MGLINYTPLIILVPHHSYPAVAHPNDARRVAGTVKPEFEFIGYARGSRQEQKRPVGRQVTHRAIDC